MGTLVTFDSYWNERSLKPLKSSKPFKSGSGMGTLVTFDSYWNERSLKPLKSSKPFKSLNPFRSMRRSGAKGL